MRAKLSSIIFDLQPYLKIARVLPVILFIVGSIAASNSYGENLGYSKQGIDTKEIALNKKLYYVLDYFVHSDHLVDDYCKKPFFLFDSEYGSDITKKLKEIYSDWRGRINTTHVSSVWAKRIIGPMSSEKLAEDLMSLVNGGCGFSQIYYLNKEGNKVLIKETIR